MGDHKYQDLIALYEMYESSDSYTCAAWQNSFILQLQGSSYCVNLGLQRNSFCSSQEENHHQEVSQCWHILLVLIIQGYPVKEYTKFWRFPSVTVDSELSFGRYGGKAKASSVKRNGYRQFEKNNPNKLRSLKDCNQTLSSLDLGTELHVCVSRVWISGTLHKCNKSILSIISEGNIIDLSLDIFTENNIYCTVQSADDNKKNHRKTVKYINQYSAPDISNNVLAFQDSLYKLPYNNSDGFSLRDLVKSCSLNLGRNPTKEKIIKSVLKDFSESGLLPLEYWQRTVSNYDNRSKKNLTNIYEIMSYFSIVTDSADLVEECASDSCDRLELKPAQEDVINATDMHTGNDSSYDSVDIVEESASDSFDNLELKPDHYDDVINGNLQTNKYKWFQTYNQHGKLIKVNLDKLRDNNFGNQGQEKLLIEYLIKERRQEEKRISEKPKYIQDFSSSED
eukprot:TRINITY_DN1622_c0_g1_i3.p1 TRINITY_DN1622_c0_g1~~TRINITY_DN1622_c0_g1_i3.p1  ORF type:complete len:452 (-),score=78.26 TRINITY_DN1622_c0_g1_i3:37-1392(-)